LLPRTTASLGRGPIREQSDAEPWRSLGETLDLLGCRRSYDFVRLKFVATFLEKPVEERGRPDQDVSASIAAHVHKLVRNAARQEDALACSQASRLAVDHRTQFAFDDVNRLVVLGVDMDRRPRVSVAFVLEEAELPRGLFSGQQTFHGDTCKNELFAVDITHCRLLSGCQHSHGQRGRVPAAVQASPPGSRTVA
jgi:hypothetical protein